ncbi:hypothetical protein EJ04DRAFT_244737 [Polyplosphaeria fusca]|uniref:Uncharacterized protein n=1 Tax=Polyplosphaeria fusca TaxID=682080 RepID=A0A9P4V1F9_9PLEO|nr:hypothetical protein EJ04DRAFT_244737 [Polyplosphaeria fusca]
MISHYSLIVLPPHTPWYSAQAWADANLKHCRRRRGNRIWNPLLHFPLLYFHDVKTYSSTAVLPLRPSIGTKANPTSTHRILSLSVFLGLVFLRMLIFSTSPF